MSKRSEDDSGERRKRMRLSDSSQSQSPDFELSQLTKREVGIIEEVKVLNFMNHRQFHFRFGEHVNFLVGLNGSGKSSVLTAIMVGLGSKAATTSRGSSLKSLIKDGKRMAEVTVRLRNRGPDAFNHDVYGDSIVIERKLTDQGSNPYRIMNADSKLVSTKRADLDAILDYFNIQVDNPVVILNQEASKEFLLNKTPGDMYRFFLKATQLEQMATEYEMAEEARVVTNAELENKQKLLPLMEREVKALEQKYHACASLEKLKEKINKLKDEMAWAFVAERERALDVITKELRAEEARMPKFVQKLEESDKKVKAKEEEHAHIQEELKTAGDEATELEPLHSEKKAVIGDRKMAAKSASDILRRLQVEMRGLQTDRNQIVQRIEEIRGSSQIDYAALRQNRERKIAELEERATGLVTQGNTVNVSCEKFRSAATVAAQKVDDLKNETNAVRSRLDAAEKKLRELVSSRGNDLRRFGERMPELVKQLQEAHRRGSLKKMPRGPIGANLKLRDGRWAFAVEKCLGQGLLTAFCVNDYSDEREFMRIAKNVYGGQNQQIPSTITSRFMDQVHKVPRNNQQFTTVLEVLDIEDPVVANCLIDQRRVEYVMLADDLDQATDVMMRAPDRSSRYTELFTINGDQLFSVPCFRCYDGTSNAQARFLTANIENVIRDCQQQRDQLRDQLKEKSALLAEAEAEARRNMQEQQRMTQQLQKLKKQVSDLNAEMNELRNVDDPAPVDVRTLEDEVHILDAKIAELEMKRHDAQSVAEDANKHLQDAENELRAVQDRIRSAAQKLDPYRERLNRIDSELDRARQELRHYKQKMKEFEGKLSEIRKRHTGVEKEVTTATEKAAEICADKIRTRRTAQNIEAEITQIHRQIEIEQRNRGDQELIKKTFLEKKKQYDDVSKEVYQLTRFLEKLSEMLCERNEWFIQMRESVTHCTQLNFQRYVRIRQNFAGRIKISHEKRTLEPVVFPASAAAARHSGKMDNVSTRALSGGERSFATTCLILALWDSMESPFRCLDEFDVFMDLVNRRLCMEMMLKAAEQKRGCQFVFLSPLNMSQLSLDSSNVDMKVFEMAPPRE